MNEQSVILKHLETDYSEPIRDPLWRHIYLSAGFKKLVDHPLFQKLGGIKQLGPTYLVYPGATHTRLNHSLGVFYLAKKMIHTLLLSNRIEEISLVGIKSFLAAALLHDLGHFPFAHSLKELPLKTHETLTAEVILSSSIKKIIKMEIGADPEITSSIINSKLPVPRWEVLFFRNLLSGVLDPDKLDYLNRDAYFCGVPYGLQDIDFILSRIVFHENKGIALQIQGLPAVENILFSKYLMYRNVYWHRTVRVATAMIKKAVFMGIRSEIIKSEELYGLDDQEFFSSFSKKLKSLQSLVEDVLLRRLYKTVYEKTFSGEDPFHTGIVDLEKRLIAENRIAEFLSNQFNFPVPGESVIIDIPEPISFEIDLPIQGDEEVLPFIRSGSVFNPSVVKSFVDSLRKVRIMVKPQIAGEISRHKELLPGIERSFQN